MVISYKRQWKIVIKTTEVKIIEWKMRRKINSHYSSIFLLSSTGYIFCNTSLDLIIPILCTSKMMFFVKSVNDQILEYIKLKLLSW